MEKPYRKPLRIALRRMMAIRCPQFLTVAKRKGSLTVGTEGSVFELRIGEKTTVFFCHIDRVDSFTLTDCYLGWSFIDALSEEQRSIPYSISFVTDFIPKFETDRVAAVAGLDVGFFPFGDLWKSGGTPFNLRNTPWNNVMNEYKLFKTDKKSAIAMLTKAQDQQDQMSSAEIEKICLDLASEIMEKFDEHMPAFIETVREASQLRTSSQK